MARPTAQKLIKLGTDLEKIRQRLSKEANSIDTVRSNPMGSDVQVCRDLAPVEISIRQAIDSLRSAEFALENPTRVLTNRKKARG